MNTNTNKTIKITIGTVQFGLEYGVANKHGQVSLNEASSILNYASTKGINFLDTAIGYGDSEHRLGAISIQEWQVISKLPEIPKDCADVYHWMFNAVQESLKRLKVKSLYALLLHRPQQLLENNGKQIYKALQQLKLDGLVQKIGISIYAPSELNAICSRYQLDLVQTPFNIFDRRLLNTGWMTQLKEQDIELHIRSVFMQGLLLMSSSQRPKKFDRWSPLWTEYEEWLMLTGLTPVQACLRYVLSFPEIDKIVIGIDTLSQLKEILQVAEGIILNIPDELQTYDIDLLNPSRWAQI